MLPDFAGGVSVGNLLNLNVLEKFAMRNSMSRFLKVSSLLTVAGVLALAPLFAKDDAPADAKAAGASAAPAAIPECLAKLNLTADQQTHVKDIVAKSDAALAKVWGTFSERYMQMVAVETSMLTAIEDHLTEPQLVQIRTHRHKTAHHSRTVVVTKKAAATETESELAQDGVTLTPEQAAASDKVQEMYHNNLHVLHRDIQGLHARLLALETDKHVQIEKVLTKEQLAQLRADRAKAPAALKLTAAETAPAKAE